MLLPSPTQPRGKEEILQSQLCPGMDFGVTQLLEQAGGQPWTWCGAKRPAPCEAPFPPEPQGHSHGNNGIPHPGNAQCDGREGNMGEVRG